MKKYKLLVDLGTSKKGDVLEISSIGTIDYKGEKQCLHIISPHDILLMLKAGMLEEVVEENLPYCTRLKTTDHKSRNCPYIHTVKEPEEDDKSWRPKGGETYWYIDIDEGRVGNWKWQDTDIGNDRLENGNCFKTYALAEEAMEKVKAVLAGCPKI